MGLCKIQEGLLNTDPGPHPQTFRFCRSELRKCILMSSQELLRLPSWGLHFESCWCGAVVPKF